MQGQQQSMWKKLDNKENGNQGELIVNVRVRWRDNEENNHTSICSSMNKVAAPDLNKWSSRSKNWRFVWIWSLWTWWKSEQMVCSGYNGC